MSKKNLYIATSVITLSALLIGAWWGWSNAGLAVLELGMGVC